MKKITVLQRSLLRQLRPRLGQVVALVELLEIQLKGACDCNLQPSTCWVCSIMQELLNASDHADQVNCLLDHVLELADVHVTDLARAEAHIVKSTSPPADPHAN